MHTPFDNPAPTAYRERVDHYARDLAWGVEQELWDFRLFSARQSNGIIVVFPMMLQKPISPDILLSELHREDLSDLQIQFLKKWFENSVTPPRKNLIYWDYIADLQERDNSFGLYELEHRAFDLLRQPYRSPRVFISYSHKNSSALALAIEARLKYLGNHDVFVDKSIPGGRKWKEVIEKNVLACDYFVLLVHENVFESEFIKQEFELALAENKTIYPVCHHGVDPNNFPEFNEIQSIPCEGLPSAKTFENAINDLLFWMGYPTY